MAMEFPGTIHNLRFAKVVFENLQFATPTTPKEYRIIFNVYPVSTITLAGGQKISKALAPSTNLWKVEGTYTLLRHYVPRRPRRNGNDNEPPLLENKYRVVVEAVLDGALGHSLDFKIVPPDLLEEFRVKSLEGDAFVDFCNEFESKSVFDPNSDGLLLRFHGPDADYWALFHQVQDPRELLRSQWPTKNFDPVKDTEEAKRRREVVYYESQMLELQELIFQLTLTVDKLTKNQIATANARIGDLTTRISIAEKALEELRKAVKSADDDDGI